MTNRYPEEVFGDEEDDGTITGNVDELRQAVVGHRIVNAEIDPDIKTGEGYWSSHGGFVITLDNGTRVILQDTDDCCAYTELETFLLHADKIEHVITGVGTTNGASVWHIYADLGDVLNLYVGWSSGNPFYYGYGFNITVQEVTE